MSHSLMHPLIVSAIVHAAVFSGILLAGAGSAVFDREMPVVYVTAVSLGNAAGSGTSGTPGMSVARGTPGVRRGTGRAPAPPGPVPARPRPDPQPAKETGPAGKGEREETGLREIPMPGDGGESGGGRGAGALRGDPEGSGSVNGSGNGNGAGDGAGNGGTEGSNSAAIADLPKPAYPRYSRIHGEEGTVVLEVEVAADGKPTAARVIRSSGSRHLDDAALDALKKASFHPARILDMPVASTKRISIRFDIREREDFPL